MREAITELLKKLPEETLYFFQEESIPAGLISREEILRRVNIETPQDLKLALERAYRLAEKFEKLSRESIRISVEEIHQIDGMEFVEDFFVLNFTVYRIIPEPAKAELLRDIFNLIEYHRDYPLYEQFIKHLSGALAILGYYPLRYSPSSGLVQVVVPLRVSFDNQYPDAEHAAYPSAEHIPPDF